MNSFADSNHLLYLSYINEAAATRALQQLLLSLTPSVEANTKAKNKPMVQFLLTKASGCPWPAAQLLKCCFFLVMAFAWHKDLPEWGQQPGPARDLRGRASSSAAGPARPAGVQLPENTHQILLWLFTG